MIDRGAGACGYGETPMKKTELVLLTLLTLPGCATFGIVDEQADSSAIRSLLQAYEAAINRRDVEAAIATYMPDADAWL